MKTVHGDAVGDADSAVDHTARDGIAVARAKLALLVANLEAHPSRDDVADLFVRVAVLRHGGVFLNRELDNHDVVATGQHPPVHARNGLDLRPIRASVIRAAVGEAYVARKMIELKAVIGGEGNGGVMYPALHVGRDAPVAGALVLALLARERATVSELVARAPRYTIVKAKVPRGPRLAPVYDGLRRRFPDAVVDTQDGLRLAWPDRWLHVRPSGTEPIIRLIAEAPSGADAERLIEEGRRLCAVS